jgi:hypothetical protein
LLEGRRSSAAPFGSGVTVIVMACDEEIVPLQSRVETVADEVELEEVFETERHLLYVACCPSYLIDPSDPGPSCADIADAIPHSDQWLLELLGRIVEMRTARTE